MKKITTFAASLTGNKGAVSMLLGILDNFSKDAYRFDIYSVYPKADKRAPRENNVNIYSGTPLRLVFQTIPLCLIIRILQLIGINLKPAFRGRNMAPLLEADLVIEVGGTTFTDAQPIKSFYNIACLLPSIILGKKIFCFSQTIGPFKNNFNRLACKFLRSKTDIVVARGRKTLKNIRDIGLKNTVYCADGAFTLNESIEARERMRGIYSGLFEGKKVVGISPNAIVENYCRMHNINHARIFGGFINSLHRKGYYVVMIPHSLRKSSIRHNNDIYTIEDIVRYVQDSTNLYVVKENYSAKELRALIGMTNIYVASRFHSMISALVTEVPVLVFGWGYQKYIEVLDEFELSEYAFDCSNLSVVSLMQGFTKVEKERDSIIERIRRNKGKVYASSMKNYDLIRVLLKEKGRSEIKNLLKGENSKNMWNKEIIKIIEANANFLKTRAKKVNH